jgi:hypothetical protein
MDVNITISSPGCCLGHPLARPEDACASGAVIQQITNCPDDMQRRHILRQYMRVIVLPSDAHRIPWAAIAGKAQGTIVRL